MGPLFHRIETFRLNRRLHRDSRDGPAYILRDGETGSLLEERYYWHGRLHRMEGPAKLEYWDNVVVEEMYYRHGLVHRDPADGPAWIQRNRPGTVVIAEHYFVNDQLYRDPAHGPYEITRYETGEIEFEIYSEPGERRPPYRPPTRRQAALAKVPR